MLRIDGSHGEGGGQILRTAVALSVLNQCPVEITNIRSNRPNPGIRPQHFIAITTMKQLCNAAVTGLEIGSPSLTFSPGTIQGRNYRFDIGTAGSITLVFQACILASLQTKNRITITVTGGTDVKWSPSWDYFNHVFLPLLQKMGISVTGCLIKRGYYPKGGGMVTIEATPVTQIKPINLTERGDIKRIEGISYCSKLPRHVAERQAKSAKSQLATYDIQDATIKVVMDSEAISPGSGCVLWAETAGGGIIGADALGERRSLRSVRQAVGGLSGL